MKRRRVRAAVMVRWSESRKVRWAATRAAEEQEKRAHGLPADRRYDGALDALIDLFDEVASG